MKIAYFTNQYPKASHSFIRREIASLESLGVEIQRISIRRPAALVDPADEIEAEKTWIIFDHLPQAVLLAIRWLLLHPLATWRAMRLAVSIGFRNGNLVKHLFYLVEALALAQWLTGWHIGHVHAHFGTNPAAVAMLCRVAGGPGYSITIHGPDEFDAPRSLALKEKIQHASFVVAISQFARSQLFRWASPADWPKIHVIHCGVDDHFLNAPLSPIPDSPSLVCVGRLSEQKGQLLLVRAAAVLIKEKIPLKLLLVGDGPMRSEIEALISHLGVGEEIKVTGWQSNSQVREHILNARALVLPSFAEGLPVVIMESLALRRPVISTYVGAIPELIDHNQSGWLVPPGDLDALTHAMRAALSATPGQLEAMAALGRARVAAHHDSQIEARRLLPMFSEITTSPISESVEASSGLPGIPVTPR